MNDLMRHLDQNFAREFRAIPKPDGLMSIDCTGIMKGNADLELSDIERIEGICAMPKEIGYE
ncbi:hypothetical protein [Xanthomonas sp. LMG 12461]|uniref:hypothetical protein n=1 Tax=Xanthomonas sp. LMG 12461 TaxID=2014543 RepID=UPI001265A412|nr:hypothetical protein [Xanthomonas sp. LMG 12461]KAB7765371.1 hypothetical protein CEK68_11760 [Xanthomonas sp. LMG 12461]